MINMVNMVDMVDMVDTTTKGGIYNLTLVDWPWRKNITRNLNLATAAIMMMITTTMVTISALLTVLDSPKVKAWVTAMDTMPDT